MELISQKMRKLAPEMDPLRLGTGWTVEDLTRPLKYQKGVLRLFSEHAASPMEGTYLEY